VSDLVLFGAGSSGRWVVRERSARGETAPVAFADNDEKKWGTKVEGIPVYAPEACKFSWSDAVWMVSIIHPIHRWEVLSQVKEMGVTTIPIWPYLRDNTGQIPDTAFTSLVSIVADVNTVRELNYQRHFRGNPKYRDNHKYRDKELFNDIRDIYFPSFIVHRDDEHFVDCGAADGDTMREFKLRWGKWNRITAFEPDPENYKKCYGHACWMAVSDFTGTASFCATGDLSAHLGMGTTAVPVGKLDDVLSIPPTFIKMDIEGSELEALWGARQTIQKHSPVLAICAYHTSDHIWQIPLLIHAIQPEYRLYLRRYAEGCLETVWYAVTPERVEK
jgi:FkbM family methyltransferase